MPIEIDRKKQIRFYNRGEPYFEFTNFAEGYPIRTALKQITSEGELVDDPTSPILR